MALEKSEHNRKGTVVSTSWYLTAILAAICLVAALPGYSARFVQTPINFHAGMVIVLLSGLSGLVSLLTAITCITLAYLLYIRKPGDRMALFVSFFLIAYSVILSGPLESLEYLFFGKVGPISLYIQFFLLTTPLITLLLVFPSGKVVPAQFRWIIYASLLLLLFLPFLKFDEVYFMNTSRSRILLLYLSVLCLLALSSQIFRYLKISTPTERQQTKVVLFGFALWFGFMLLSTPIYYFTINIQDSSVKQIWQNTGSILWQLGLAMIPVSLTISIIRSHLWDIDVIIRRTLIYTLLTASLGIVYFSSILLLQGIFTSIGIPRSPVVIVLSTLAIIALIAPLRRRIQDFIDRRFYRKRYNAEQILAAFSAELRDKVDLDQLSVRVLDVVQETVQPESLALWLAAPQKNNLRSS